MKSANVLVSLVKAFSCTVDMQANQSRSFLTQEVNRQIVISKRSLLLMKEAKTLRSEITEMQIM